MRDNYLITISTLRFSCIFLPPGVESVLFRSFFHKWDNVLAVDYTRAADKVNSKHLVSLESVLLVAYKTALSSLSCVGDVIVVVPDKVVRVKS